MQIHGSSGTTIAFTGALLYLIEGRPMVTLMPSATLTTSDPNKTKTTPAIPTDTPSSFMNLLMARLGGLAAQTATPAPVASQTQQQTPTVDAKMKDIIAMVLRHEGSTYVRRDAGEESSKFGILQATAAKYGYTGNVKNMSQAEAEEIYKKIWAESGASDMPFQLAAVHFDTYINSPAAAKRMLKQSGGDVNTYLRIRSQRYVRLAHANPARFGKYAKGWMNRIQSLKNVVAANKTATQTGLVRPT